MQFLLKHLQVLFKINSYKEPQINLRNNSIKAEVINSRGY